MYAEMIRNTLILSLILATSSVLAANINICENVADKIFLEDVTNCTKYYLCLNGQANSRQCENGLYFDAAAQACTSNNTGCLQCPKGVLKTVPLAKTCNKYVLCFDGAAIVQECTGDLQYNPTINKCDLAKNVDCVANQCSVYDNNPYSIKYFNSAANCANYYVCMIGKPQPMSCAAGLYFSTQCNCCDLAANVKCTIGGKSRDFHEESSSLLI